VSRSENRNVNIVTRTNTTAVWLSISASPRTRDGKKQYQKQPKGQYSKDRNRHRPVIKAKLMIYVGLAIRETGVKHGFVQWREEKKAPYPRLAWLRKSSVNRVDCALTVRLGIATLYSVAVVFRCGESHASARFNASLKAESGQPSLLVLGRKRVPQFRRFVDQGLGGAII
jgi:hypothetical protein